MLQKKIAAQVKLYKGILLGIALAIGLSALAAFTEPSQAPPGCTPGTAGCDAPLNVGTAGQSKSGGLILGTGSVTNGLIVQNGNVGIGTTSPNPSYKLDVAGDITASAGGRISGTGSVPSGMIGFFAGACPSGWSEYTDADGRAIVAITGSKTNAGTVGIALGNQAPRTITDVPNHSHPFSTNLATKSSQVWVNITSLGIYFPYSFNPSSGLPISAMNFDHNHTGTTDPVGVTSVDVTMPYIQLRACQAP